VDMAGGNRVPATAGAAGCRRPGVWSAIVAVRNRLYPVAAQVGILSRGVTLVAVR